jgi:hypothetical protein
MTQIESDFLCAGQSSTNVQEIAKEMQESMQNKEKYVYNGIIAHCDHV